MIQNGNKVKVHYTGKFQDETVFDTSVGKQPLEVVVGEGKVIKGFEKALIGKNVGDRISVVIEPSEGYGMVREDMILKVDRARAPVGVKVGANLQMDNKEGRTFYFRVTEINEENGMVTVNGNHPLSGKILLFDIEILEVT